MKYRVAVFPLPGKAAEVEAILRKYNPEFPPVKGQDEDDIWFDFRSDNPEALIEPLQRCIRNGQAWDEASYDQESDSFLDRVDLLKDQPPESH